MKNILIADDSASIRTMVSFTLNTVKDVKVTMVNDGREALAAAQRAQFDLVLTDQNMPNMTGLELVKAMRALPGYAATPILMLTTESGQAMKDAGRAAGATGWLVKPFDPQKLLGVVNKLLG